MLKPRGILGLLPYSPPPKAHFDYKLLQDSGCYSLYIILFEQAMYLSKFSSLSRGSYLIEIPYRINYLIAYFLRGSRQNSLRQSAKPKSSYSNNRKERSKFIQRIRKVFICFRNRGLDRRVGTREHYNQG